MFFDYDRYTYYVTPGGTDMRKGVDSLARLVWEQMHLDSRSRSMFLFCSRNRKTLAVLVWGSFTKDFINLWLLNEE